MSRDHDGVLMSWRAPPMRPTGRPVRTVTPVKTPARGHLESEGQNVVESGMETMLLYDFLGSSCRSVPSPLAGLVIVSIQ